MINAIVAYGQNREIGVDGDLPWGRSLPHDMRHFVELTTGNTIVMGRKTFESFGARPLKNRTNVVVSRADVLPTSDDPNLAYLGSVASALAFSEGLGDIFVIGGSQVYEQALPKTDRIYVTEVDATFDGADVFFPALDPSVWTEADREHFETDEKNAFGHSFVTYERR